MKRHKFKVRKNLEFKVVDSIHLKGDIYQPETNSTKLPAVVVVHGGGWTSRSGDMSAICKTLAKAGFVAFNITYRLAPKHRYPKALEDVRDAITWLHNNANQFNIDTNRIGGWGYSAGAHLILMAGLDDKAGLKSLVAGGTPAYLPVWPRSPLIFKLLGVPLHTHKELWEQASPVNQVSSKSPPVFLYHGQLDVIVEFNQMNRMRHALEKAKVTVETYTAPWMGHFAVYLFSRRSVELGLQFLKNTMAQ